MTDAASLACTVRCTSWLRLVPKVGVRTPLSAMTSATSSVMVLVIEYVCTMVSRSKGRV